MQRTGDKGQEIDIRSEGRERGKRRDTGTEGFSSNEMVCTDLYDNAYNYMLLANEVPRFCDTACCMYINELCSVGVTSAQSASNFW